jgi:Enolase C-terminal domain-like
MLKIMAVCDTHKVGIVPHFTGPIATAGHMHTMMAFPGQVLMEYNQGERPVPYLPEFLECRNGKVWPNDRPGLGVSVDEKQLTFIEAVTEGHRESRTAGPTDRSRTGSRRRAPYARTARCATVYDRGGSLNVIRLPADGESSR